MAPSGTPRFAQIGAGPVAKGPLPKARCQRTDDAMSMPRDVPELATPQDAALDEAEAARYLEEATRMVQEFAAAGGPGALSALLALSEEAPAEAAENALHLATTVTAQTTTLHGEVARFLSVTRES